MPESDFDYDPEKDSLPKTIKFWLVVAALAMAIYLASILV